VLRVSAFSVDRHQEIHYIKQVFCGIHTCVLCNVLTDDGLQKMPKHVAVTIHVIKTLLRCVGENMNMTWNLKVISWWSVTPSDSVLVYGCSLSSAAFAIMLHNRLRIFFLFILPLFERYTSEHPEMSVFSTALVYHHFLWFFRQVVHLPCVSVFMILPHLGLRTNMNMIDCLNNPPGKYYT
jgi:hypothetical protein